jgi:tRNA-dihydrouridine synthase
MKEYGNTGKIYELRKFFKIYINGFEGASKIRQEMMEIEDGEELLEYVKDLNF